MTQTFGAKQTIHVVATALASGYHAVAQSDAKPIEYPWIARCAELPGCMADGRTAEEALDSLESLIPDFIGWLREDGLHVPLPGEHLSKAQWEHEDAYYEERPTSSSVPGNPS